MSVEEVVEWLETDYDVMIEWLESGYDETFTGGRRHHASNVIRPVLEAIPDVNDNCRLLTSGRGEGFCTCTGAYPGYMAEPPTEDELDLFVHDGVYPNRMVDKHIALFRAAEERDRKENWT